MVGTMVRQLLKNATTDEIEAGGFAPYFLDHGKGVYPASAAGYPWLAEAIASGSDPIANLNEDLAAEQKARMVYDNILRLATDPQVIEPIRFLREREIVHYQRFGEALRIVQDKLTERKYY